MENRHSQGPLHWTCNSNSGITLYIHIILCTRGCLHLDQALTQVPVIVLRCSFTLPEVTLVWPEFYAFKISCSVSLGWVRGYFLGDLGQPDRQFEGVCALCLCMCMCVFVCVCECVYVLYTCQSWVCQIRLDM